MSSITTLNRMSNGSFALVTGITAEGLTRRRLLDLGLVPGTKVEVIRRSPVGDPIAFNIRGAVIALRREVAGQVLVTPWN
ncbi:FeoA family protein [Desulfallas thermosapovorans]|uniref:Ferrous iron transport protein A n=1 Tax=Desulfallas thermosapovorans DSM 6562 TaxID=1121431 RepID=A0A5S4ZRM8_9FIRM|nr:FeoA family protein [Desulfallas thermosapovorans]TYO95389.1 ferrous iron transport protein A [Desulfallas thermosapovorans DSM 6562]